MNSLYEEKIDRLTSDEFDDLMEVLDTITSGTFHDVLRDMEYSRNDIYRISRILEKFQD